MGSYPVQKEEEKIDDHHQRAYGKHKLKTTAEQWQDSSNPLEVLRIQGGQMTCRAQGLLPTLQPTTATRTEEEGDSNTELVTILGNSGGL